MKRKEINERSPIRVLEASIHGGLGAGNLGVILARHGVGKTAFLVGVALDDLMRGRKVLHISMEHSSDRVRSFYDEVFTDLARESAMEDMWKVRLEVERNRRIHCYLDGTFSVEKLTEAINFMGSHSEFKPDAVIIDGFPFAESGTDQMEQLRQIANETGAEIWMSAHTHRQAIMNEKGIPEPIAHLEPMFDVILRMAHDDKAVHVSLLKDHDSEKVSDLKLALDPTTLLLVQES